MLKIPGSVTATQDFSRFDKVGTVLKIDDVFLFKKLMLKLWDFWKFRINQNTVKCRGHTVQSFGVLFTMGRHLFTADYTCFRTTFMTKSNAFV